MFEADLKAEGGATEETLAQVRAPSPARMCCARGLCAPTLVRPHRQERTRLARRKTMLLGQPVVREGGLVSPPDVVRRARCVWCGARAGVTP